MILPWHQRYLLELLISLCHSSQQQKSKAFCLCSPFHLLCLESDSEGSGGQCGAEKLFGLCSFSFNPLGILNIESYLFTPQFAGSATVSLDAYIPVTKMKSACLYMCNFQGLSKSCNSFPKTIEKDVKKYNPYRM